MDKRPTGYSFGAKMGLVRLAHYRNKCSLGISFLPYSGFNSRQLYCPQILYKGCGMAHWFLQLTSYTNGKNSRNDPYHTHSDTESRRLCWVSPTGGESGNWYVVGSTPTGGIIQFNSWIVRTVRPFAGETLCVSLLAITVAEQVNAMGDRQRLGKR